MLADLSPIWTHVRMEKCERAQVKGQLLAIAGLSRRGIQFMSTLTPETDALDEGLSNYDWSEGYGVPLDFARKLERERSIAVQSAKDNAANFRKSEVKRIEAERERDEWIENYKKANELKRGFEQTAADAQAENIQLRKVCDELYKASLDPDYDTDALSAYTQLPHVKNQTK